MVPWPIALLAIFYMVLGSSSAATVWQVTQRQLTRPLVWAGLWCVLSTILVIGLVRLRPWARRLAVFVSVLMAISALGTAGLAIAQENPEPMRSLFATGLASIQLVVIRYLTRPHVKAWFAGSGQVARWQSGQEHT